MAKIKLLLIADDRDTTEMTRKIATEMFYAVQIADHKNFADQYALIEPEVIVLDIVMADMKGFEVLQFLKDQQSKAVILLLSGRQDSYHRLVEHLSMAAKLNIHANLPKPFRDMELRQQLREIHMAIRAAQSGSSQEAVG